MASTSSSTTTDKCFFYEDVVYQIDKRGRAVFGLVLENEYTGSDTELEDNEPSLPGTVRVAWHPSGKEKVLGEHLIGLADRTLMPGDVVRRLVPGKKTQRGYCRDINMRADLKIIGTDYVVKNVKSERLTPILDISRDCAVSFNGWIGSIKVINESVIMKSTYGAIIEVSSTELETFTDKYTKYRQGIFGETVFYPGQTVYGRLNSMKAVTLLTPTIALKLNSKLKILDHEFLILSTTIKSIKVRWQCKNSFECTNEKKAMLGRHPESLITEKALSKLKFLNLFEPCMLQINDKSYLKIDENDMIVKKSNWKKEQGIKYKLLFKHQVIDKNPSKYIKKVKPRTCAKIKIKLSNSSLLEVDTKKQLLGKSLCKTSTESSHESSRLSAGSSAASTVTSAVSVASVGCGRSAGSDNEDHNQKNNEINQMASDNHSTDDIINTTNSPSSEIVITNCDKEQQTDPRKYSSADDWVTEEDEDEDHDYVSNSESTATRSTCSSPTPKSSPKCSPLLKKKQRFLKKTKSSLVSSKMPETGEKYLTEALLVYCTANVIWQDGTIENDIPSTQLYPIHHLDENEFFPGDFVLPANRNGNKKSVEYGVVQTVDHNERTARVNWLLPSTDVEKARPTITEQEEVSVYELRDHADFQFRPGTIIIPIGILPLEDPTRTVGQIIDNYIDGMVKVWWVDGKIQMCWPNDLCEVAPPDSDCLHSSDSYDHWDSEYDSWETDTENENSDVVPLFKDSGKLMSANLERARAAIARLEEIFNLNPFLQTKDVMTKLLTLYKKCRYIDRLMGTAYFHEDNFMGLLERVQISGSVPPKCENVQDSKIKSVPIQIQNRSTKSDTCINDGQNNQIMEIDDTHKMLVNHFSTPLKYSSIKKKSSKLELNSGIITDSLTTAGADPSITIEKPDKTVKKVLNAVFINKEPKLTSSSSAISNYEPSVSINTSKVTTTKSQPAILYENKITENVLDIQKSYNNEKNKLLSSVMSHIEKFTQETEKRNQLKLNATLGSTSLDDSGAFSRTNDLCDGSSTSYASSNDLTNDAHMSLLRATDDQKSVSCSSFELIDDSSEFVCVRMCRLLKQQLVKCLKDIQFKYDQTSLNSSNIIPRYACFKENEIKMLNDDSNNLDDSVTQNENCDDFNQEDENNLQVNESKSDGGGGGEKLTVIPSVSRPRIVCTESFKILESAPACHKLFNDVFEPHTKMYFKAINREHKLLRTSLPPGVMVRAFEDRMDLFSVMIEGPAKTPYEDGLFLFDIQLGSDYPIDPPTCLYMSYCTDRLNPNLYEDGKVCVSLLGTWAGRDSEVWGPNSTLLQVIVSIQGLILVADPYYNEAGYEKQKGSQQGGENARTYNEMVIIKLIQSMTQLIATPPLVFKEEVLEHFRKCGKSMVHRVRNWTKFSNDNCELLASTNNPDENNFEPPEFSLVPTSRGFIITVAGLLDIFERKLASIESPSEFSTDSKVKVDQPAPSPQFSTDSTVKAEPPPPLSQFSTDSTIKAHPSPPLSQFSTDSMIKVDPSPPLSQFSTDSTVKVGPSE